jgi:hypothetical protein
MVSFSTVTSTVSPKLIIENQIESMQTDIDFSQYGAYV